MTRRSAAVKGSRGGVIQSVRGSGSRFEVGNEVGRRPHVAREDFYELAVGIDDGGAQVVDENRGALGAWYGGDTELRAEPFDVVRARGQEMPDGGIGFEILRVRFQYGRRIVGRIEADGD